MRVRASATLLVLVLAGAGCLGASVVDPASTTAPLPLDDVLARLSQPVFEEIERLEAFVKGADDVDIWLDVYLPVGAEGPLPTILVNTPYQAELANVQGYAACVQGGGCDPLGHRAYSPSLRDYFVPRGYAVAFSDVRGNHRSGGCNDMTGLEQGIDAYNTIEWIAEQPWSNGKVGMYGISNDGETQFAAALLHPPHLTTIVPVASVASGYEYPFYDGVPYEWWGANTWQFYWQRSMTPGIEADSLTSLHQRPGCQIENARYADLSGDDHEYWQERDFRPHAANITASVLQVHGLVDWNVKPNHVDPMWSSIQSEKRLILGQWAHAYPDRPDWLLIRHRWFDHYLLGIDTGILDDLPAVLIEDDTGEWRGIDAFPPVDPLTLTFHPSDTGALGAAPPAPSELVLRDHVRDAAGLRGLDGGFAPAARAVEEAGAAAGEAAHGLPAALSFTSDPFEQAMRFTGRPFVQLVAATDAVSTHWVVHLYEIDPAGERTLVNRGYFDTRHREGLGAPKDLAPGEEYRLHVRMFPQETVIEAGNAVELVLTNDDDWIHQDPTYAVSRILLGTDGTRLVLPLAPADARPVPEEELRAGLEGYDPETA